MSEKHLHIDPCGIHFGNSFLANIAELFKQLCGRGSEFQGLCFEFMSWAIQKARTCEMLFKRYGSHMADFPNLGFSRARSLGSIPPTYVDTARKILKEVPFDFVLLRPSLRICVERAASREEGAIRDHVMLEDFYTRFEEGAIEPICDDNADPLSLAHRIVDGLNEGRFPVL